LLIDAEFLAKAGLNTTYSPLPCGEQKASQSQVPVGREHFAVWRNLAPDFTHYISEAHEKHMRTHNGQPTRSHRAENGENPDRSVHYYNRTPEKPTEEQSPAESPNKERQNQLLLLAVLIVSVGLVGTLVWEFRLQDPKAAGTEHNAVLGITIFIQAMIAFFGILNLDESHATKVSPLTKGGMRGAITGAVVVTYVSLVIFHTMVEFAAGPRAKDVVTDTFINSFTEIVKITIVFYFASEAVIHWINKSKSKE
jgi:hypothetical protein